MEIAHEAIIKQFGVKGMHWGTRKATKRAAASEDARSAQDAHNKAKKNGLHSLSNKELQDLVTRMGLEKQFKAAQPPTAGSKAAKFIGDIVVQVGKQQVSKLANDAVSKEIAKMMGAKK